MERTYTEVDISGAMEAVFKALALIRLWRPRAKYSIDKVVKGTELGGHVEKSVTMVDEYGIGLYLGGQTR